MLRTVLLVMLCACSEYNVAGKTDVASSGGEPAIDVDPRNIDFGTVNESGTMLDRIVTIYSVGDASLDVYAARLAGSGAPFSVTTMGETAIAASESIELVVSYTAIDEGESSEQLIIESSDPEEPESLVHLNGAFIIPDEPLPPEEEPGTPIIEIILPTHDFGTLDVGESAGTEFAVRSMGDATLVVTEALFDTPSPEMSIDLHLGTNGPFPWNIAPGDAKYVSVTYAPSDAGVDTAQVLFRSNDEENPEATFTASGIGRGFDGFSTGWYIYDDGLEHETTSSTAHPVTTHGDTDLYWYEPSGAHGLIGSTDPEADFAMMRDHVLAGAGEPTPITGPISFESGSTLATFAFATFTYVMCDFWIEEGEDPAIYSVQANRVDDGIQVMVNGEILGHMLLGDADTSWSLADVARPGEVNTLIVILVDDSASNRYLRDLAFFRDGVMVEGS